MSCSPFDLKDYFFGELREAEREAVQQHLKSCAACREELQSLRLTRSALLELRDEEMPHRIGFVSDRVYEPSAVKRWWRSVWGSAPRLAFASAAMLSLAILTHGVLTRVELPGRDRQGAAGSAQIQAEVDRRVADLIRQAVAESEARQSAKAAAYQKEIRDQRRRDVETFSQVLDLMERQMKNVVRTTAYGEGN